MAMLLSAAGELAPPLVLGDGTTLPVAEPAPIAERATGDERTTNDDRVRQEVWSLLAGFYPAGRFTERRKDQRFPLPRLILLTPIAAEGLASVGPAVVVAGKDISERGLGFYHPQPLGHRRMIASLEMRSGRWVGFLIDINWCRFTRHRWYDSGGRILQVVNVEQAPPVTRPRNAEHGTRN